MGRRLRGFEQTPAACDLDQLRAPLAAEFACQTGHPILQRIDRNPQFGGDLAIGQVLCEQADECSLVRREAKAHGRLLGARCACRVVEDAPRKVAGGYDRECHGHALAGGKRQDDIAYGFPQFRRFGHWVGGDFGLRHRTGPPGPETSEPQLPVERKRGEKVARFVGGDSRQYLCDGGVVGQSGATHYEFAEAAQEFGGRAVFGDHIAGDNVDRTLLPSGQLRWRCAPRGPRAHTFPRRSAALMLLRSPRPPPRLSCRRSVS